jgi:hypothetical protein
MATRDSTSNSFDGECRPPADARRAWSSTRDSSTGLVDADHERLIEGQHGRAGAPLLIAAGASRVDQRRRGYEGRGNGPDSVPFDGACPFAPPVPASEGRRKTMTHHFGARRVAPHTVVCLLLAAGLAGCGPGYSAPTSPSGSSTAPRPTTGPVALPPVSTGPVLTPASLSGVVSEATPDGPSPIAGVEIYCDACGEFGHTYATTDSAGAYHFGSEGIWLETGGTRIAILVHKDGYLDPLGSLGPTGRSYRYLSIGGDTRFDFQLVRR